ncbi:NAD-dependent succinate-semialdehyde dehydrogenase [Pinisolibacter aquiterrae]|uniref:NAD-dependent succinate-semialdehyde dehydrogenase n=1 Tax=Pinisolibacter aquiterrae TaxID=2815579 RepID=UPI001C3D2B8A|nr:NAD-dependent succinate-semialdehyde dehydrogenase [Pinisolibacter aquiterrae]MBV5264847.1 NAD-dependent succinate-semialdehyde dehydrogenase [Pinisolibacter aquiterrae]MCC8234266.1 NAD-dependent succinate-semialdehyde dehydrogenase [Pinisolibacter aquiterrae]
MTRSLSPLRLDDPDLLRRSALIGGVWSDADDGATLDVEDPATGAVVGTVPACGAAETRRAIEAAAAAFPAWRRTPAGERARLLERWNDLILAVAPDLARIMTAEQGKPLGEAEGEVRYGASFVKWFAEEARRVYGHTVPAPTADRRILVLEEPIGVTAAITPWNFPIAMITRKAGPALAAGCTMVIKPSELTPFSALAIARLAERAGIPAGVISVVTGLPVAIGDELTANPIVRKISFTGSTRVGAHLMRASAGTLKKLSLELGGNAPFIVFDDADLDIAVEGAMASKFRNAGQTCVCANRILVQSGIHDAFVARLAEKVAAQTMGPGTRAGVTIGPLINAAATAKVRAHVEDALAKGAAVAARVADEGDPVRFAAPMVLTGATTDMMIANEETFGPVAPIFRFETEAEAIAIANGTPFGLAAYFYTEDLHRAWRVGEALEFGMVGLNTGSVSMEVAPFGGLKQSGLGREGGSLGIAEYLEPKAFHMGGLKLAPVGR